MAPPTFPTWASWRFSPRALARPGSGRHRTLFLASAVASAVILLKLFGVPPIQWLGRVPVFNEIHFSHYLGVPLGLPLAFLASLGLERIVRGTLRCRRP